MSQRARLDCMRCCDKRNGTAMSQQRVSRKNIYFSRAQSGSIQIERQRYTTETHLNTGFVELRNAREVLPHVDVRVVALGEGGLQLLQLLLCEGRAVSSARGGRTHRGVVRGR